MTRSTFVFDNEILIFIQISRGFGWCDGELDCCFAAEDATTRNFDDFNFIGREFVLVDGAARLKESFHHDVVVIFAFFQVLGLDHGGEFGICKLFWWFFV